MSFLRHTNNSLAENREHILVWRFSVESSNFIWRNRKKILENVGAFYITNCNAQCITKLLSFVWCNKTSFAVIYFSISQTDHFIRPMYVIAPRWATWNYFINKLSSILVTRILNSKTKEKSIREQKPKHLSLDF